MTVNLTRIYTRLGDGGQTHLGDMSRVLKTDARVEAYGTVDELNSFIGLARTQPGMPARYLEWLGRIQNDLLDVGADLCVPDGSGAQSTGTAGDAGADADADDAAGRGTDADAAADSDGAPRASSGTRRTRLRVDDSYITWLEQACDEVNDTLQPLRSFVIPGGSAAAAHLHICRTVCRRAERRAIAVGAGVNGETVRYLNRLSDLLFILARGANELPEHLWQPGAHSGER